jgi:hypothetical protein
MFVPITYRIQHTARFSLCRIASFVACKRVPELFDRVTHFVSGAETSET